MNTARLNDLVALLERAPDAPFDGAHYVDRGTGCCAMGAWALEHTARWRILNGLTPWGWLSFPWPAGEPPPVLNNGDDIWAATAALHAAIRAEFGVTDEQRVALFGGHACGGATTRGEAARYVKEFAASGGGTEAPRAVTYRTVEFVAVSELTPERPPTATGTARRASPSWWLRFEEPRETRIDVERIADAVLAVFRRSRPPVAATVNCDLAREAA